jgi:hypothetical protein
MQLPFQSSPIIRTAFTDNLGQSYDARILPAAPTRNLRCNNGVAEAYFGELSSPPGNPAKIRWLRCVGTTPWKAVVVYNTLGKIF